MISIIAVGKVRQSFIKEGINEFLKRLQKYSKVEYKEVSEIANLKGFTVTLDEAGKQLTSHEFATFIKQKTMQHKDITFIIGEATGIPEKIKKSADASISLSKMTFPTQLARLIFIEQLYRAFTINNNEPYHKN